MMYYQLGCLKYILCLWYCSQQPERNKRFMQVLQPNLAPLCQAPFTPMQQWWHLPNLKSPYSTRLPDRIMVTCMKQSGRKCWCWARLFAARKISNQLVDDSGHKFSCSRGIEGCLRCSHAHNFEIFLVNNVYAFRVIASKK